MTSPIGPDERKPVISYAAYHNFVSIIFSVAMVAWGAALFGMSPVPGSRPTTIADWWNRDLHVMAAGLLYGGTLICMYWIYADRIAALYRPTNLFVLLVDFIALSFLTAAAFGWTNEKYFNTVAVLTVGFLMIRFGTAAQVEKRLRGLSRLPAGETLMRDVTLVYLLYLCLVLVLMAGAFALGGGVKEEKMQKALYVFVLVGMLAGIATTVRHSFKPQPEIFTGPSPDVSPHEEHLPLLTPAYGVMSQEKLARVSAAVFEGESWFRRIVTGNARPEYRVHQSLVHTYRDVETQAFIMAYTGRDEEEITLRAMWVYLAHWFDDVFDGPAAPVMANWRYDQEFDVGAALKGLDPSLEAVWRAAIDRTMRLKGWETRRWFLETGFRRLMLGGPMFAASCADQHPRLRATHKDLILRLLKDTGSLRALVENTNEHFLAYTAKVVVEIWDSFAEDGDYDVSVAMNMFYAPGLLYHDSDAEFGRMEMTRAESLITDRMVRDHIGKVFQCLKELPQAKRRTALRPVPMFMGAFGRILEARGLHEDYRAFMEDERVSTVIRHA